MKIDIDGFETTEIELRPITIITGHNGSGKTQLLSRISEEKWYEKFPLRKIVKAKNLRQMWLEQFGLKGKPIKHYSSSDFNVKNCISGLIPDYTGNVLLEQPERCMDLHNQTILGSLVVTSFHLGNNIFLETLSEIMILRIQKIIGEGGLSPDNIVILNLDKKLHGKTIVQKIHSDKEGEFTENWIGGFFAERVDELC